MIAAGIAVLVVAGANLGRFFWVHVAGGLAMLVVVAIAGRREVLVRPNLSSHQWMPLLREAAPLGIAVAVNTVYLRTVLILTSVIATSSQTGLYAASDRIIQVIVASSWLMTNAAFPILARAGGDDDLDRLAYSVQRLGEVTLFLAIFLIPMFFVVVSRYLAKEKAVPAEAAA